MRYAPSERFVLLCVCPFEPMPVMFNRVPFPLSILFVLLAVLAVGCADEIGGPDLDRADPPALRVASPGADGEAIGDALLASVVVTNATDDVQIVVEGGGLTPQALTPIGDSLYVGLLDLDAAFGEADAITLTFTAQGQSENQTVHTQQMRRRSSSVVAEQSVGASVKSVAPAPDGTVWFVDEKGLGRYRSGAFETVFLDGFRANGVAVEPSGTVWASVEEPWRLLRYDGVRFVLDEQVQREVSQYAMAPPMTSAPDGSLWFQSPRWVSRWAEGDLVHYLIRTSGNYSLIRSLAFDAEGRAWTATGSEVLQHRGEDNWQSVSLERVGLADAEQSTDEMLLNGLGSDGRGTMWVVGANRLAQLDGPVSSLAALALDERCAPAATQNYPVAFAAGADGSLWFTAEDYVLRRAADGTVSGFAGAIASLAACTPTDDLAVIGEGHLVVLRDGKLVVLDVAP